MDQQAVLGEFRAAQALLEGHFLLSSGLHSSVYLQCARVLMNPERAARLCQALAFKVRARFGEIPLVVSPAMGGVIVGYEMARQLGADSIFTERVGTKFSLRRGFAIKPGQRILMVEDVVTTGLSSRECIETITAHGGSVVAAACLIDRSGGKADIGVPLVALAQIDAPLYKPDALPDALRHVPAVKPGSRNLV
ncbi:orotate phosphoribosyltransferase [Iodidimonas gelatinilytica]|uniref:Orotate phosphoribosyltransferase n=1 Tax=Iodidimonas gelatinilytica TaxID=1236966 RepID=A0A5A7MSA3_9PROT|nr:orotate phosphoribosyltransferase [Iodidimonas gelatinilytica]GEQ98820.1 orotate phosphoribosyltransferase [Iodidimonas gelatinilytica]GER01354.1 orotate phosphoribosyltransferase [Iodidimonas gelatinilytica]